MAKGTGGSESYPTSEIPNKYMLFFNDLSISLLLFFHFLVHQRSESEIQEGCNSNFVRLRKAQDNISN